MIYYDVDLTLKTGQVVAETVQDGRDTLDRRDGMLRLVLRPSDAYQTEICIPGDQIAISRITRRETPQDAPAETYVDAQTRTTGDTPDVH